MESIQNFETKEIRHMGNIVISAPFASISTHENIFKYRS